MGLITTYMIIRGKFDLPGFAFCPLLEGLLNNTYRAENEHIPLVFCDVSKGHTANPAGLYQVK